MEAIAQFNKVFVIESLSPQDLHAGTHLVEEIKPTISDLKLGLCFWKVGSRRDFESAMKQIWAQCARNSPRTYPMLHIEAHGCKEPGGIMLYPSGEVMPWSAFANLCRNINRESHNNLFVTTGLCFGLNAITAISLFEEAPFFALLGPEEKVSAAECDCISIFYNELLRSGDVNRAHDKLSSKFGLFLAERLFMNAYASYVRSDTRGSGRQRRIDALLSQAVAAYGTARWSLTEMRRKIKERIKPNRESFEEMKNRFLMSSHPDNESRFQGTFETALLSADDPATDTEKR